MSVPFKHVLIIGATSGIGAAMADHFSFHGVKVTAVGRRQERLDEFCAQHGNEKASGIAFDIEKLDEIPAFVENTFKTHPDIDCVFLNAATQARFDFSKPETVDLGALQSQITINFNSQVALVHAMLPHLLSRSSPTGLIFTGSPISLIPVFPMPAYGASKAALESFVLSLREQLRDTNVTVQQISPGPVQTELHDAHAGKEAGRKFGMPMEDFVKESWVGLVDREEDIYPGCVGGSTKEQFLKLVKLRDEASGRMSTLLRSMWTK